MFRAGPRHSSSTGRRSFLREGTLGCNWLKPTISPFVHGSRPEFRLTVPTLVGSEAPRFIYDKYDGPRAGLSLRTNIELPKMTYPKVGLSVMDSLLFFLFQISILDRSNFRQSCLPSNKRSLRKLPDFNKRRVGLHTCL